MAPDGRGPGMPQGQVRQQQNVAPSKSSTARNESELYDKLIRGGADLPKEESDNLDEFDDSLPTANHSKTETDLTRSKASLMSNYRGFLNSMNMNPSESQFIKETSKNLMFINQSSKAKKGFGDMLVRTDHVYQTVDEYNTLDHADESGGVVDSLKKSLSGAGGTQVVGNPAQDGFTSQKGNNQVW